ncbi:MAG: hypothetical protein ACXVCY_12305 [Pseudobdellovibrionaceae bacterium]
MKMLILSLFVSASAFASPFSQFIGSYKPAGTPKVYDNRQKSCEYSVFNKFTGLRIYSVDQNVDGADIVFNLGQMDSHVSYQFNIYSLVNYGNVMSAHHAEFRGDSEHPIYHQVDSAIDTIWRDWSIYKSGAGYHLRLVTETIDFRANTPEYCVFDVDLVKE